MATASGRARSYLSARIARLRRAGEYRLPPYGALAAQAGVSPMTMLKALREYRERGILLLIHGTGATRPRFRRTRRVAGGQWVRR
jgi:DNA-binding GntR family transcriptional regulator